MSLSVKAAGWKNRIAGWFVDREFFMRSNGQVRFVKISAKLQKRVAGSVAAVVGLWTLITLGMAINQASISYERMSLVEKAAAVQSKSESVANYRKFISDATKDIEKRQDMLETMTAPLAGEVSAPTDADVPVKQNEAFKKISAAIPEAAGLAQLEARQVRFAEKMTKVAQLRAQRAANAIRQFGLNPEAMAKSQINSAQGGPFIPFFGNDKKQSFGDPRFDKLAAAVERMAAMEGALASVPTAMPARVGMVSSSYGYRRDPFTGAGAMHSGLDFKGPIGTPILAAADGVISFAGQQSGYGNTIEITHANGLVTRYAHLSGFTVTHGQKVARGVQVGKMGSTGRSTGSHLHFEVRLNGQAVNPLKFLEANNDVLEVQALAGSTRAQRASGKKS
ncbi:M23 family metallopeptidase [Sphingorhabdus arenilitoris]|uniref:M23 family metallopeptidase n=1 Tax=Sphingorhabdus arenilitoris TaxID=1490041 RepID=A0ABV8RHB8_9SPHN